MRRLIQMKHFFVLSAALAVLCVGLPGSARASTTIGAGWDLFVTKTAYLDTDGTPLALLGVVAFEGNPLDPFDFGSGPIAVDGIDTIVHRIGAADLTLGQDTIDIELVALSLISVTQYDIGNGNEDLLATLSFDFGDSWMTIFDDGEGDPHGTYDSYLHFAIDITGSISGFLGTIEKEFWSVGNDWRHTPPGSLVPAINGVNVNLAGGDDFHLVGEAFHDDGTGTSIHIVTVPEPGTGLLLGMGLIALGHFGRRKRGA